MGRPFGSKNKSSAASAVPAATAVASNEVTTQSIGQTEGIRRTYKEGGAVMEIPQTNNSSHLFGDAAVSEEVIPQEQPVEEVKQEEPVQEPAAEQAPAEEPKPDLQPTTEEVVYLEDLLKKMNIDPSKVKTKTKVDGVEADVPFSEVKKSYQLEQHLTKRGQKIGEERRQLEAMRNELAQKQVPADSNAEPESDVALLRKELDAIRSVIQPTIYQNARQKLANDLKDQGFPDFNDYIDKIDARVALETDDAKWSFYNTFEGAKQLYFQMKLEEARNQPVKQEIPKKEAPRPPVVKIDGGSRPSQPINDDYNTKVQELMTEWRAQKNTPKGRALLTEILRLKGALTLK